MVDTSQIIAVVFAVIAVLIISFTLMICREGCKCCCIKRDVGVVSSDEEQQEESSNEDSNVKNDVNEL